MDILLYLVFGVLDQMAVMIIAFKMFRFPVLSYIRDFLLIAFVLSLISYFNRFILDIPQYDAAIQYIVLVVFFRRMFEFRLYEASLVVATGCAIFTCIKVVTLSLFLKTSVLSLDDLVHLTGLKMMLIQLLVDVLVVVAAWLVKKLNMGYSFMSQPPHNLNYKLKKSMLSYLLIVAAGLVVFVMTTFSFAISQVNLFVTLAYGVIPLFILLWLLTKRDYQ
ncbi:membrane protein [Brevibacillus phage Davies]|uniref:Membrane protein n=1 Tax=Brevibacillus phage Davies TaxID=1296662 RepID=S5MCH4_9CAUD|nr:membrane protein [Brevibacillus phage Davies]AGR47574.1 putative membrane protein [Brevibacillus phage Davies]